MLWNYHTILSFSCAKKQKGSQKSWKFVIFLLRYPSSYQCRRDYNVVLFLSFITRKMALVFAVTFGFIKGGLRGFIASACILFFYFRVC